MTNKPEVESFHNRGLREAPYGFIYFTDGLRIGYSPGSRGTDPDGLFNPQQPYLIQKAGLELRQAHWSAAQKYVREVLKKDDA